MKIIRHEAFLSELEAYEATSTQKHIWSLLYVKDMPI